MFFSNPPPVDSIGQVAPPRVVDTQAAESPEATTTTTSSETNDQKAQQPLLTDTVIENENIALNVMVSFMYLAQKRGAFNLKESSKIWECVKLFIKE